MNSELDLTPSTSHPSGAAIVDARVRVARPLRRPPMSRSKELVAHVRRFIFRCQFCDTRPDPLTQVSLEQAMRENTWGAYQDAMPGKWLVFHGRGLYGSPRYACPEHRGDLVAYLREHIGTIGFHVWKRPPYPTSHAHSDTEHAWFAATRHQGGWGS